MGVQFDILSYMGNLYGFHDKTHVIFYHFTKRNMGCNAGMRYFVAMTGVFNK